MLSLYSIEFEEAILINGLAVNPMKDESIVALIKTKDCIIISKAKGNISTERINLFEHKKICKNKKNDIKKVILIVDDDDITGIKAEIYYPSKELQDMLKKYSINLDPILDPILVTTENKKVKVLWE
jgi:hypothetical protein